MLKRRTLMGAGAAIAGAVTSLVPGRKAFAKKDTKAKIPEGTLAPRGSIGVLERLPELDLDSRQDFLTAFRTLVNADLSKAGQKRADQIVAESGLKGKELSQAEAIALLENDPTCALGSRVWISAQQLMWSDLVSHFDNNADKYLSEMEAVDKKGPGTLELNPEIGRAHV